MLAAAAAAVAAASGTSPAAAATACAVVPAVASAGNQADAEIGSKSAETVSAPATSELTSSSLAFPLSGTSTADSAVSTFAAAAESFAPGSADSLAAPPSQPAHATWANAGTAAALPSEEATAPGCSVPLALEASPLQGAPPAPQLGHLAAALRARAAAAADIVAILLVGSGGGVDSSSHLASPIVLAGELVHSDKVSNTAGCRSRLRLWKDARQLHPCITLLVFLCRDRLCH